MYIFTEHHCTFKTLYKNLMHFRWAGNKPPKTSEVVISHVYTNVDHPMIIPFVQNHAPFLNNGRLYPLVFSQTWLTLQQNCHIAWSIYIVYLERVFTIILEIENFIEFSLSFLPRFCVRVTVCGCVCVLTFNITTYESACLSLCVRLGACVYITCVRMYESLYELALTKSSTTSLLFRVCFSCWPFSFLQVTFTQFLVISILTYICPPFLYFFHKGI